MYLKLAENIIMLRRKKGITQDQLAAFLGVTKASVSKWETKQSFPDILLLPQIAAYFDISIDTLLGYEPQLSKEQIKKCYQDLASEFSELPFDEVIDKSRELVKKYYSCYPLLMQIVILWVNHFMLTQDKEQQTELLKEATELCNHILDGCNVIGLCSEASIMKSTINLILGNAKEVIDELEPIIESKQIINQAEWILIQAYQMTGDTNKADLQNQVTAYMHLLSLVESSTSMICFHIQDQKFCETTIQRIQQMIDTYQLEKLHPNVCLKFHYQLAIFYCVHNQKEKALQELTDFVVGSISFIESGLELHGDEYFTRIDEWFDEFALKREAPKNGKVIMESLIPAIENPALGILFETETYKGLKSKIERKINSYKMA